MEDSIDSLWLIIATFMVLTMQAGFLLLEGGSVRSKNSINVAQKNITDIIVVWVVFFAAGFTLMSGVSINELINGNTAAQGVTPLHFVFQAAFCATTATIVSGAVAERMSFKAYLCMVAVIGALIYPLAGRMIWGDSFNSGVTAWLSKQGFIDFAGSTVVHGVGAWMALVAVLMIGPRRGRFDEHGNPRVMAAHNAVIALFGVFILMFGWIGFNGGSISPGDPLLPKVVFNTLASAFFGGAAGMLVGIWLDKATFNPGRVISGLLGGLVACTAGVHFFGAYDAILIGGAGGAIATWSSHHLLHRYKFDDPLDVVAIHGIAGVLGTLAVAWVAPVSQLAGGSRWIQLLVQMAGVVSIFLFTATATWITLSLLRLVIPIRVPADAEELGLNYTEHGQTIGLDRLKNTLQSKLQSNEGFASALTVDRADEHSELVDTLNSVIHRYEQANQEILQGHKRFQQFAETASDCLWETDSSFKLRFIHSNSAQLQNVDLDQLIGCHLLDILQLASADLNQVVDCMQRNEPTPVFEAALAAEQTDDSSIFVEVRAVPDNDKHGFLIGYRGTFKDISVRKTAESQALYLSLHDELTGLPNRRALNNDLQNTIDQSKSTDNSIVVAGVDLDGFKGVNDSYGHDVGDQLLKQVANRLREFLRPEDIAYRTGGDEFVVVFNSLKPATAMKIGESVSNRLISEVGKPYSIKTLNAHIGASVGLACYPNDSENIDDILRMADLALYAAKDAGKGCVVKFEESLDIDARLQRELENDLHEAIAENQLYLMYQPQVDTHSESIIGYEALLRWTHPERGEIPPGDFIGLAETLNLMDKIGEFVLRDACKFASTWTFNTDTLTPKISVNISPCQLRNNQFAAFVKSVLKDNAMDPRQLEIEITEGVLVHDFHKVSQSLHRLKDLGVSVAVDDFGTGQTSLRYISQFPLSTIKIDRSFVKNLHKSEKAAEITRTIVNLGKKLAINVIAEGVEENDQLALLKQWNCDQIQGYLFSRPVTRDIVEQLLNDDTSLRSSTEENLRKQA